MDGVEQFWEGDDRISCHCLIMKERGLIEAGFDGPYMVGSLRITWARRDLLDDVRGDSVWKKTKRIKMGGLASSGVGKEVDKQTIQALLAGP